MVTPDFAVFCSGALSSFLVRRASRGRREARASGVADDQRRGRGRRGGSISAVARDARGLHGGKRVQVMVMQPSMILSYTQLQFTGTFSNDMRC